MLPPPSYLLGHDVKIFHFLSKDGVQQSIEKLGVVKKNPTGISRVGIHSFLL